MECPQLRSKNMRINIRSKRGLLDIIDSFVNSFSDRLELTSSMYLRNGDCITIVTVIIEKMLSCNGGDIVSSNLTLSDLKCNSTQIIDVRKFNPKKALDYRKRKKFYDFIEYIAPYIKKNPFLIDDKYTGLKRIIFDVPYQLNAQTREDRYNVGYGSGKYWGHTSAFKIVGIEYH